MGKKIPLDEVRAELRRSPNVDTEIALSILRRGGDLVDVLERVSIEDRSTIAYCLRERAIEAGNHEAEARYSREFAFWWSELTRAEPNDDLDKTGGGGQPFDIQQRNAVLESIGINVADATEAGRLTSWELEKYSIEELLTAVQNRAGETNYEQRERTTTAFNKASIAGFHRLIFIEDRKPTRGNVNKWLKANRYKLKEENGDRKKEIANAIQYFRDKFGATLKYIEVDSKDKVVGEYACTITTDVESGQSNSRFFVVRNTGQTGSKKTPRALPYLRLSPSK